MANSTPSPGVAPSRKVKNPRPRKLAIVVGVLLVLSLGAAIGGYVLRDHLPLGTASASVPAPVSEPVYVALEPMTVNLRPDDPHQFLHVGVTLKVADAKMQAQVTQYLPEVTSRLMLVLSNRESGRLISAADKTSLASEVLAALNQPFGAGQPSLKITGVLFPVFMVQ